MTNISEAIVGSYPEYPFINVRGMYYFLHPQETYYKTLNDVPNLTSRVVPAGTIVLLLEVICILLFGKNKEWRLHTSIVSWTSTAMYEGFSMFVFRGIELTFYTYCYDNFRLFTFPWNSFSTYVFAMLTVEFFGYWWHRAGHELAIMWASHEFHHSSEDFNLAVAFRNSAPMRFFRWTFYIPLAFCGLPASIMVTHLALGSIYNGAIHLHDVPKLHKILPGLGHLMEFIFVTPSHHRVHHASNRYCIDRNYGQFMIVWDRLFGTFVEEKEDETLVFGTITPETTFDIAYLQINSFVRLWQKMQSMNSFGDKLRTLLYGPGWAPGKPRLGDPSEIPDVRGREKFDPKYPWYVSIYLTLNAFGVFYSYLDMAGRVKTASSWLQLIAICYIFYGFACVGGLYDKKKYSPLLELSRIIGFLGLCYQLPMLLPNSVATIVMYIQYLDLLMLPLVAMWVYDSKKSVDGYSSQKLKDDLLKPSKKHQNGVANGQVNHKLLNKNIHKSKDNNTNLKSRQR